MKIREYSPLWWLGQAGQAVGLLIGLPAVALAVVIWGGR